MFLNYLALAMLIIGALLVFYTFIYIHNLPHEIAKKRNHPHSDAIHVACWLSLLTLHAIGALTFEGRHDMRSPRAVLIAV